MFNTTFERTHSTAVIIVMRFIFEKVENKFETSSYINSTYNAKAMFHFSGICSGTEFRVQHMSGYLRDPSTHALWSLFLRAP